MIDWNIQSRAHRCQSCNADFTAREAFHTLLYDQRHGYERMDVCGKCWTEQFSQGGAEKKGFVSHWQGIYTPPPPVAPDAIQRDTAESLLRKLVEQNQPEFAAVRFILAVMLERKRILKVKTQLVEGGRRILIYEHPKSGDLMSIADPDLQLNQLEQVQRDVAHLLEHGLPADPAGTPAAAPEVADVVPAAVVEPAEGPALVESAPEPTAPM